MNGRRRNWREARAVEAGAGFAIQLDARPLRLPGGDALLLATSELAAAIALEWTSRAIGEELRAHDIPLTRLAALAQQRIAPDPQAAHRALLGYAKTDLLCYRATAPEALVRRQAELWQPWLDWAESELGAALKITHGVVPAPQDGAALAALEQSVQRLDASALAALWLAVPALGSLILGLALARARISGLAAAAAALVEEAFQASVWGEDPEAEKRRAAIRADILLAERYLALAQGRGTRG